MSDEPRTIENEPESRSAGGGWTWTTVLVISAIELLVLVVIVLVVLLGEFEPILGIFGFAFIAGLAALGAFGRSGAISLFVAGLVFTIANLPFTLPTLDALNSPVEFILNLLFLLGGFGVIVSGVQVLRRKDGVASMGALRWLQVTGVLFLLLSLTSVVVRMSEEQVTAQAGDQTLVAEDTEFSALQLFFQPGPGAVFIENRDVFSHTFTVDGLGIDLELPGSSSRRVVFTASEGDYEFRCTLPGHEQMKGTLVVR